MEKDLAVSEASKPMEDGDFGEKDELKGNTGVEVEILPEGIPVLMPDLPTELVITTLQQFKAFSDPVRLRILRIIQNQPATAKQIAERLEATPGTIGHHLHVLEAAGLAQVVARRLMRGIVAKYYTRTARIFDFKLPSDMAGSVSICVDILTHARDELAEAEASRGEAACLYDAFPHVRISPQRAAYYQERLLTLVQDLLHETHDPAGVVYGVSVAIFEAPSYMQK